MNRRGWSPPMWRARGVRSNIRSRSLRRTAVMVCGALAVFGCSDGGNPTGTSPLTEAQAPARHATTKPLTTTTANHGLVTQDLTTDLTATDVAQTVAGSSVTISNVSFTGAAVAAGEFSGGEGIIGFDEGIILSTGRISNVIGPNTEDGVSAINGRDGDEQLTELAGLATNDAAILEFDFVPVGDTIVFQYVFSSDEYNEFVGSEFNDVFAFYVNGENCALVGDPQVPVTINTINGGNDETGENIPATNPELYRNNDLDAFEDNAPLDTEMDGLTVVLTCRSPVQRNQANRMRLAIADGSDFIYDSNVFIEARSLVSVNQPPMATVASPTEGATFTTEESITFSGSGSDPEDGTLTGNSLVWTSSLDGQIGTGTSFSTSSLQAGEHLITLTVTDSQGRTGTATRTITVTEPEENQPPTASITSPDNNATFDAGETITFRGSATDPEDGELTGGSLVWTAEGLGQIGTGRQFTRSNLPVGEHTIVLTATDSDGATATATVMIDIKAPPTENQPPVANITAPANNTTFTQGEPITFEGSARDAEDGDLSGGSLVWTILGVGQIGTGESFTRDDLPVGTHTVILTATDSEGAVGTDQITIAIAEPPVEAQMVEIDIKPGVFPNTLDITTTDRNESFGVAILSTSDFDATEVIPGSLTLGNDDEGGTPAMVMTNGTIAAFEADVDGDGDQDLIVYFCVVDLIESGDLATGVEELILLGRTTDGNPIRGSDSVEVVSGTS